VFTARLQAAINSAANLPAEEQDKLAAQIESAILNAQWSATLLISPLCGRCAGEGA